MVHSSDIWYFIQYFENTDARTCIPVLFGTTQNWRENMYVNDTFWHFWNDLELRRKKIENMYVNNTFWHFLKRSGAAENIF